MAPFRRHVPDRFCVSLVQVCVHVCGVCARVRAPVKDNFCEASQTQQQGRTFVGGGLGISIVTIPRMNPIRSAHL